VFLVASLESDRASEVLLECEGCERHPSPRWTQRQGAASGAPDGSGIAGTLTRRFFKGVNSNIDEPLIVSSPVDPSGVRAADGLARRMDSQQRVEDPQRVGCFELYDFPEDSVSQSLNAKRARDSIAYTLTAPTGGGRRDKIPLTYAILGGTQDEDALLPVGLDSHRYRCCGNGVVAPVAEWVGRRIVEVDRRWREEGK
jgi:site-specific DNA-cytosine methylase